MAANVEEVETTEDFASVAVENLAVDATEDAGSVLLMISAVDAVDPRAPVVVGKFPKVDLYFIVVAGSRSVAVVVDSRAAEEVAAAEVVVSKGWVD